MFAMLSGVDRKTALGRYLGDRSYILRMFQKQNNTQLRKNKVHDKSLKNATGMRLSSSMETLKYFRHFEYSLKP